MQDTSRKTIKASISVNVKGSNIKLTFSELIEVKETDYIMDVIRKWQDIISKSPIMEALNDW